MSYAISEAPSGIYTNTVNGLRIFAKRPGEEYPIPVKITVSGIYFKRLTNQAQGVFIIRFQKKARTLKGIDLYTIRFTPESRVLQFVIYISQGTVEAAVTQLAKFFDEIDLDQLEKAS